MALRAHSGRGRRRKPSNRTRNLGLATAPLVAAIPFAMTNPAQAATTNTWERLANCESGGNWHINTGNGYYGGLQFNDGTWDGNGGNKYASRADRASKSEQIAIAEKILDARGWSPWPACSSRLGLGRAEAAGSPGAAPDKASSRAAGNRQTTQPASRGKHRKAPTHGLYVVRRGDSLSGIARSNNVPGGWQGLYRINRAAIGSNPGMIKPGQRLAVR
jgi:resuscitation-promoting factor RpfA